MWRLLPLLLLPVMAIGFTMFGLQDSLVWTEIGARTQILQALADHHAELAAGLFILAYAGMAAMCLPIGPAMGVVGGALFGPWAGTAFAILGATVGALPLFLWARASLGTVSLGRHAIAVARVRRRLQQDGFPALLALRVAPVLPSWALNLGAGLGGLSTRSFVVATTLGLVPATMVFASIGAGLGSALAQGTPPSPALVMQPGILLPLLALSGLALLPVVLRATRSWQSRRPSG